MRLVCLALSAALHLFGVAALQHKLPADAGVIKPPPAVAVRPVSAPPPMSLPQPADPRPQEPPAEGAGAKTTSVAEISPVKRDLAEPGGIWIGKGELKQGAELSLSMRALTGFDFGPGEFCGYYLINGTTNRVLSVIDGRKTYGRLLIHDSATGMLRALTRYAKFIYTYGASFDAAKPVEGSITFLARKDFERTEHVDDRSRIIWLANEPQGMIGTKFDFIQETVRYQSGGAERRATLIALKHGGPYPLAVFAGDGDCRDREIYWGLARLLAVAGVAVAVVDPPGCGDEDLAAPAGTSQAGDLVQALRALRRHRLVDSRRAGYFGYGRGARAAAKAALVSRPAFTVLALDATGVTGATGEGPLPEAPHSPVLLVLTAADADGAWPRSPLAGSGAQVEVLRESVPATAEAAAGKSGRLTELFPVYLDNAVPFIVAGHAGRDKP
jgi:hypothetical protein